MNISCAEGHVYISQSPAELTCQTNGQWNFVGANNPAGALGDCVGKYKV